MDSAGSQDAVVSQLVQARVRDESRKALDECERFKDEMRGAFTERRAEFMHNTAIGGENHPSWTVWVFSEFANRMEWVPSKTRASTHGQNSPGQTLGTSGQLPSFRNTGAMSHGQPKLDALFRKRGMLRSRELVEAGLSRGKISRLVEAGELMRLTRGLYALPDYQLSELGALTIAAKKMPSALFCLLTALRVHELTSQAPFEVWVAIEGKAHSPRMDYPPLRVVRYSSKSIQEGVEEFTVQGVSMRVTTVAKTVVDCFKYRGQVGLDVAIEALRAARKAKRATAHDLWHFAKVNRVTNVIRPYLEAVE
jgi:hypothetical protein